MPPPAATLPPMPRHITAKLPFWFLNPPNARPSHRYRRPHARTLRHTMRAHHWFWAQRQAAVACCCVVSLPQGAAHPHWAAHRPLPPSHSLPTGRPSPLHLKPHPTERPKIAPRHNSGHSQRPNIVPLPLLAQWLCEAQRSALHAARPTLPTLARAARPHHPPTTARLLARPCLPLIWGARLSGQPATWRQPRPLWLKCHHRHPALD
jgi:hypothetical protein